VTSGLCEISIDTGNPFFHVNGSFIVDSSDLRHIWYFGTDAEVTIPTDIETICFSCFGCSESICTVDFGGMKGHSPNDTSLIAQTASRLHQHASETAGCRIKPNDDGQLHDFCHSSTAENHQVFAQNSVTAWFILDSLAWMTHFVLEGTLNIL
jgi:hypothetical protein